MTIFLITRRAKVEKHSLGSCYHLAANVKGDISLGCHPHGWQYRPQILVAKFVFGHHKEQNVSALKLGHTLPSIVNHQKSASTLTSQKVNQLIRQVMRYWLALGRVDLLEVDYFLRYLTPMIT